MASGTGLVLLNTCCSILIWWLFKLAFAADMRADIKAVWMWLCGCSRADIGLQVGFDWMLIVAVNWDWIGLVA